MSCRSQFDVCVLMESDGLYPRVAACGGFDTRKEAMEAFASICVALPHRLLAAVIETPSTLNKTLVASTMPCQVDPVSGGIRLLEREPTP